MSLNTIISNSQKRQRNKRPNDLEAIRSHITSDEINANPLINNVVRKITKIKFNSLTRLKPQLTPVKDIKDEKEIKLINNLNSFRKIFYEYNKNQQYPKKYEPKVYKGEKYYNFSKIYKHVKEKDNLGAKEMLDDIKKMYNNNDYSLPSIDTNLFSSNLLLLNEGSIKNSIVNKLNSEKSNKNTLSYLTKIYKNVNNQLLGKENYQFPKINEVRKKYANLSPLQKNILITKNILKKEIPKSKSYINNIKETINYIDDIDFFFESNNQEYFNYLKNPESIKNSISSTRVNSPHLEIPKININDNNLDIYKLNKIKKKFNNLETKKNNKSNSDINDKNKVIFNDNFKKKINIYNLDNNPSSNKKKVVNKNLSMDNINIDKKNNLIKLKKLYLNGNIQIESKKISDLQIQTNEKLLQSNKRISINVQKPNTYGKLVHIFPKSNARSSMPLVKNQNITKNKSKLSLERIYNIIKKNDDFLESKDLINSYMKNKKNTSEPKISVIDVCNHYQKMRENIIRNDLLKKSKKLKQLSGFDESTDENIKSEYEDYMTKLNNMADDVNKIISKA